MQMSVQMTAETGSRAQALTASFNGRTLRYLELADRNLLLCTADVCDIAGISDRSGRTLLATVWLSLAGAVWITSELDREFAQWLTHFFSNYKSTTATGLFDGEDGND
jgi:hypothetical protein